jgi:hypothetical protein
MNRPVSSHAPDLIQNSLVNLALLREIPMAMVITVKFLRQLVTNVQRNETNESRRNRSLCLLIGATKDPATRN